MTWATRVSGFFRPDPKHTRVKDPAVYKAFHAAGHTCLACGSRHVEAAHLLRGKHREDDINGLVPLCHGCHEAFDKDMPYRGDFGHWFTPEQVKGAVARTLRHEAGDDWADYLRRKLGPFGAEQYVLKLEGRLADV